MDSSDLIVMLHNLSSSLPAVQEFFGGFSYLFGLIFCVSALVRFKEMLNESGGNARFFVPSAYLATGLGLLFLPTLLDSFSSTLFGSQENILAYSSSDPYDIYSSMIILVQTIGIIWFIRGCILLGHSSEPQNGQQGSKGFGRKGLLFIVGGLFAVNLNFTIDMVANIINLVMDFAASH